MKSYTITCTQPCAVCEGSGRKASSRWLAYLRDTQGKPTKPVPDCWARDKGFSGIEESVPCDGCGAAGHLNAPVSLIEALQALGFTAPDHFRRTV